VSPSSDDTEVLATRINSGLVWVEIDGEVVVYKEAGESIHLLNWEAAPIWHRIDGASSVPDIARELADMYQADVRRIANDGRIVEQLEQKELLTQGSE
jgi:hypothetical protein